MVRNLYITVIFTLLSCGITQQGFPQKHPDRTIRKVLMVMKAQEEAWNTGDINGYMKYYWNSDSLKFITKSGVTYGWKAILEHYKESYPDKTSMGKLSFSNMQFIKNKNKLVFVTGKWQLVRDTSVAEGWFSLIWKRFRGKWLIIVDHTS